MNAKKLLAFSNARIIFNQPSTITAFFRGGKIEAYREVIRKLLENLTQCDLKEISDLLEKSKATSSAVFPEKTTFLKTGNEFTNILMLYYIIRTEKPQIVMETGVWTGKTSWTILQALADNGSGHLISIDLGVKSSCTSQLPIKEIGGFVPENLRSYWTLVIGDAKKLVPDLLQKHGPIDLFYHDSDHSYEHMMFEFKTAYQHIKNNGMIGSDDINLSNAWKEFSPSLRDHFEIDNLFGYGHK
jgi:predicted O-methyltransferase YrrM